MAFKKIITLMAREALHGSRHFKFLLCFLEPFPKHKNNLIFDETECSSIYTVVQSVLAFNHSLAIPSQLVSNCPIGNYHGSWRPVKSKKDPKIPKISQNPKNQNRSENVSHKIGPCCPKKLVPFNSLSLMRKSISSGQKWILSHISH